MDQSKSNGVHPHDALIGPKKKKKKEKRKKKKEKKMILTLPIEVVAKIFAFLSPGDLRNVSLVSKEFARLSSDQVLWKHLLQARFPNARPSHDNWRLEFAQRSDIKRRLEFFSFFPSQVPTSPHTTRKRERRAPKKLTIR